MDSLFLLLIIGFVLIVIGCLMRIHFALYKAVKDLLAASQDQQKSIKSLLAFNTELQRQIRAINEDRGVRAHISFSKHGRFPESGVTEPDDEK